MPSVSVGQRVKKKGEPWRVLWRDATGKQRQKTFTRKGDADSFADELRRELRGGSYIDPAARRTLFGTQYDAWRSRRHAVRSAAEDSLASNHVLPRWKDVALEDITHESLQSWVNDLRTRPRVVGRDDRGHDVLGDPYAWATVRDCRQLVRDVLSDAVLTKRLGENVAEGVTVPNRPHRDITSDDVLSPEEVAALVAEAPARWAAFLLCCSWLGWRLSEGLRITRGDLRLDLGRVTIRGTKSRAAVRVVPLPEPIVDALREHLRHHVRDQRASALLWPGDVEDPFTVADRSVVRRVLQRSLKKAELHERGIDYRQLRHTAASLMLAAGVTPLDVSYRLGHADIATTLRIYTHLMPPVTQAGTDALTALMRGGAPKEIIVTYRCHRCGEEFAGPEGTEVAEAFEDHLNGHREADADL
jgi:integrase